MSTTRCKHGNVTSDTMGSYACVECNPAGRIEELEVDNARLRALIKKVEYGDGFRDMYSCPWCGEESKGTRPGPQHTKDCPAFTPDGVVR